MTIEAYATAIPIQQPPSSTQEVRWSGGRILHLSESSVLEEDPMADDEDSRPVQVRKLSLCGEEDLESCCPTVEPLILTEARLIHLFDRSSSVLNASHVETGVAYTRPEFIYAKVIKPRPDAKVGLFFKTREGATYISRIVENSLFSRTDLQPGDRVISINNKDCLKFKAKRVIELIQKSVDTVSICVRNKQGDPHIVSNTVQKVSADSKIGVALKSKRGALFVSRVLNERPFAHTLLMPGHRCLMINNISCENMSSHEAVNVIANSPDCVTIVSRPRDNFAMVLSCKKQRKWWKQTTVTAGAPAVIRSMS